VSHQIINCSAVGGLIEFHRRRRRRRRRRFSNVCI